MRLDVIRQRLIGHHEHICADQLARIALQAGMHAVRQKADRRQRSHGQHQRYKQQVQLTSAPIAAQHAQGLGPDGKT
jgi:hypothetical protein